MNEDKSDVTIEFYYNGDNDMYGKLCHMVDELKSIAERYDFEISHISTFVTPKICYIKN